MLKQLLIGLLSLGCLTVPVWAYRTEEPSPISKWDCPSFSRLNHYLHELWNITNGRYALDTISTNPNSTRPGDRGEMVQATYSGTKKFCVNMSDPSPGTTWQCIVIDPTLGSGTACAIVEDLAAADDNFPLGHHSEAITIRQVSCTCTGTCTTVAQISLEDGSSNAMTHTTPVCTAIGTIPTAQTITAGGSLSARESLRFDVDNTPSPETDTYEICWSYTLD